MLADLKIVKSYGIEGAPALVVNQKYIINGAQPQKVIETAFEEIAEKEGVSLTGLQIIGGDGGAVCQIIDGQWMCD